MPVANEKFFDASDFSKANEISDCIKKRIPFSVAVVRDTKSFDAVSRMIEVRISGRDGRSRWQAITDAFRGGRTFALFSMGFASDDYAPKIRRLHEALVVDFLPKH